MKRSGKKLAARMLVLALLASCIGAALLSAWAAAYDAVSEYILDDTTQGRIADAVIMAVGDKMYAYAGRMATTGVTPGITVLDVTTPEEPKEIQNVSSIYMQDSPWVNERMYAADGQLYVLNHRTKKLERYSVNADGTLPTGPAWSSQDSHYSTGTIKVLDDLMFVSTLSSNGSNLTLASVNIYDISDAANTKKLTTATPVTPTMENLYHPDWTVTEQIATYATSVVDLGGGKYRIFGNNRAKFGDVVGNKYFLSIRDVTVANGTYTVETLYEGQPEGTVYAANGDSVFDIDALNENMIAVVEGSSNNKVNMLELIDVSDPRQPRKLLDNGAEGQGTSAFVDGNRIFLSTKDRKIYVYQYTDGQLTKERELVPPSTSYQMGEYAGFLYSASQSAFTLYEYKAGIAFSSEMIEDVKPVVAGTVNGYRSTTDRVAVMVDGVVYNAAVGGNRFSIALDALGAGTYKASAKLLRTVGGVETLLAQTGEITICVAQSDSPEGMLQIGSIPQYKEGTRITDVVTLNCNGKTYLYTTYCNDRADSALIVYDITDGTDYAAAQSIQVFEEIESDIFNSQMQIKDGYLFVSQYNPKNNPATEGYPQDKNRYLYYYKLGADGKLPVDAEGKAVGTKLAQGSYAKLDTIEIVDNYLFHAQQSTNGCCTVYDVSDIANGVRKLGATEAKYAVWAPAVEKISDDLYRLYYVSRTDQIIDGTKPGENGYQFVITDMQVGGDGNIAFTQQYSGVNVLPNPDKIFSIKDIEAIGVNKAVMVWADAGNVAARFLIDSADPTKPVITPFSPDVALSVENLNDGYYAIGAPGGTLSVYKKSDNAAVKSVSSLGQVYTMHLYNGKMAAATDKGIHIFQMFTTATSTVDDFSVVNLTVTDRDGFPVSDVSSGDLTVTARVYNPESTARQVTLYLAVYDSITEQLDYAQTISATVEQGVTVVSDTIHMMELSGYSAYPRYLKAFVWTENMQALAEAYKVP